MKLYLIFALAALLLLSGCIGNLGEDYKSEFNQCTREKEISQKYSNRLVHELTVALGHEPDGVWIHDDRQLVGWLEDEVTLDIICYGNEWDYVHGLETEFYIDRCDIYWYQPDQPPPPRRALPRGYIHYI